jgi:hypothetical protein
VDKINGQRIECMEDVVRAFESNKGRYDLIEFLTRRQEPLEALDREEVRKVNDEILKTYHVPKDRRL